MLHIEFDTPHCLHILAAPPLTLLAAADMGFINFGVSPDIADEMASKPDSKGTVVVVGAGCAGGSPFQCIWKVDALP